MGMSLKALAGVSGASLRGDPELMIDSVATLQDAGPGAISFLANRRYISFLQETRASAVILSAEHADDCPIDCLVTDNPYLAHARVLSALYPQPGATPGVDPSSRVDSSAKIAATASIGPLCFVGADVVIGEDVEIGPGCVLLDRVVVGAGTRLVASVTLATDAQLGERCLIHPGAVIGSDGFGLANDEGAWIKVAQIGRAILGNDVEVGSCTSVDRGAIGDTVLADGVKLDSQVHVAHNVQIGKHCAFAGCSAVAGSSKIGAYCTLAGGAGISGHVELADHVHISATTTVTGSIREPGVYTGTIPAMDHAVWSKNLARLRHLDELARRVKALEKELAALSGSRDETG